MERIKSVLGNVFLVILVKALIDLSYGYIISIVWPHAGFVNRSGLLYMIISWTVSLASIPFFVQQTTVGAERVSSLAMRFMYVFSFIPFTTCIGFGLFDMNYIVYGVGFWTFLFFSEFLIIRIPVEKLEDLGSKMDKMIRYVILVISLLSFGVTIYMCYKYTGFRLHFNIMTVYDIREEASHYDIPIIMEYLYSWTKAVNPFMIAYCVLKNKKVYAGLFVLCSLLNFGFDGSKTALFFPVIFLGLVILYKLIKSFNVITTLLMSYGLIGIAGIIEFFFRNSYYICGILIRRVMFVENLNSYFYYDFFTKHTPDYFKMSFLRHFGYETQYPDLVRMIGRIYQGVETNSNCGLIADAVTNFGVFGVLGYPLMFFMVMCTFDVLSQRAPSALKMCAGLYVSMCFVNTFMFTSLLTHGIFILLILMFCVSRQEMIGGKSVD